MSTDAVREALGFLNCDVEVDCREAHPMVNVMRSLYHRRARQNQQRGRWRPRLWRKAR